jgi:NAD(P)-dependent dehydrogenase (short-subunit alcohol dehydrogenase family)
MPSKLIVILGATGNQGGSVAEAFLSEPGWKVRALTRNTSSAKAQALSSKGAEVVQADLDDPSSLNAAFEGAHAIFAVSDFWGLYNEANRFRTKPGQALNDWASQHEEQQLKNVIDIAAKIPTLERFILSSLSHSEKWSKGKYTRVYHFDGKARATEYAQKEHPHLWAKTSVYQAGLFLSNFILLPPNQPFKVNPCFIHSM